VKRLLQEASDAYFGDPLAKLSMLELSLIINFVVIGVFYLLSWPILALIATANIVAVGFRYYRERKLYVNSGGKI